MATPAEPAAAHAHRSGLFGEIALIVLATLLVALAGRLLFVGFRSTPWLDDSWAFWLPHGIVLDRLGLDTHLFVPNGTYTTLVGPDYPLAWSVLLDLATRFGGRLYRCICSWHYECRSDQI